MPTTKPPAITGTRPNWSISRPAGSAASGAGRQEDRRPEAEDRLDPGDEDERDRGDGDGQLQHAREQHEAETEQCGVAPDRIGDRLDAAIQPGTAHAAPRRARYDPRSVWGARANRAERAAERAADPKNLIWVIPAEEGRVSDRVVVVVAGGEAPDPEVMRAIPRGRRRHCRGRRARARACLGPRRRARSRRLRLGRHPRRSRRAEAAGARIERHPADKDATDLELALDAATGLRPRRIVVLAGDRRPARPPPLAASCSRLAALRGGRARCPHRARASARRPRRADTDRRGAASCSRSSRCTARPRAFARKDWPIRSTERRSSRARAAESRTSSSESRHASRVDRGVLLAVRPGRET